MLSTAPTPVNVAQPNSVACSGGRSGGTGTTEASATTVCSAKPETPRWWLIRSSPRENGRAPESSVPSVFARAPGSHRAGRPFRQGTQAPHDGTKAKTTWSPGRTVLTPTPTSSMTPVASWPSAIGSGLGRAPVTTDRSEWQMLAAVMRTRTSPAPGGSSVSSSTCSGRVWA